MAANIITDHCHLPDNIANQAEQEANEIASDFIASKRHSLKVYYHLFVKKIKKHIPKSAPEWRVKIESKV